MKAKSLFADASSQVKYSVYFLILDASLLFPDFAMLAESDVLCHDC